MKLHFESGLDYQTAAIRAVTDLFLGQENGRGDFTVTTRHDLPQLGGGALTEEGGVGNRLLLLPDRVEKNLRAVQARHGLAPSGPLAVANRNRDSYGDFTVEMETGTGKTYVYLRTILELHQLYGFSKFIIVVPSVAIRAGVMKTLDITREHFAGEFNRTPYHFFEYDSAELGAVRTFATEASIQIMVMTIGAINKMGSDDEGKGAASIFHQAREKTSGWKPIELVQRTRPIVIVDEPQSVDGGDTGSGKRAIDAMTPLFTLRYSATHKNPYHPVFKLDAVEAYRRKLVKQIEVVGATTVTTHNTAYVKLLGVTDDLKARVELEVKTAGGGAQRVTRTLAVNTDLEDETKRDLYRHLRIENISRAAGGYIELSGYGTLHAGHALGDPVPPALVAREMIAKTIVEHFKKELKLRPLGIKVLSLFFVEKVADYRDYARDDKKGELARIFEEEYTRIAAWPEFAALALPVEKVHNGYFSQDKAGTWKDTAESGRAQNGEDAARAYDLIMKSKEKLLALDEPLRFLFSHSALREGWDNPNVFQICSLREVGTEMKRRQILGRGLRLAVNNDGLRVREDSVNILTVIARESVAAFAENLQTEIAEDTGYRFGFLQKSQFSGLLIPDPARPLDDPKPLGADTSQKIYEALEKAKLIKSVEVVVQKASGKGKNKVEARREVMGEVLPALKDAVDRGTLKTELEAAVGRGDLPADIFPAAVATVLPLITQSITDATQGVRVRDARERKAFTKTTAVETDPRFLALWERIKRRTAYSVEIDTDKLIDKAVSMIQSDLGKLETAKLVWTKAELAQGQGGIAAQNEQQDAPIDITETGLPLPDIVGTLEAHTELTRKTLVEILRRSGRLDDFRRNPQQFIERVIKIIDLAKIQLLEGKVKYRELNDREIYEQSLFLEAELTGYAKSCLPVTKSTHDHIRFDSGVESAFAADLEKRKDVTFFMKLPKKFSIPTPLGSYEPDWAVLIEKDGVEKLYFVAETKGTDIEEALSLEQRGKVKCGRAHFKTVGDAFVSAHPAEKPAEYVLKVKAADL